MATPPETPRKRSTNSRKKIGRKRPNDKRPGGVDLRPKMFLFRLNKIMDEYAGGTSMWCTTNKAMLERALEEFRMLYEDSNFPFLGQH